MVIMMTKVNCVFWLAEGKRLSDAADQMLALPMKRELMLQAIISLQNSRSSRDCCKSTDLEVAEVIRDMRKVLLNLC